MGVATTLREGYRPTVASTGATLLVNRGNSLHSWTLNNSGPDMISSRVISVGVNFGSVGEVINGLVLASGFAHEIHAYDVSSGRRLWQTSLFEVPRLGAVTPNLRAVTSVGDAVLISYGLYSLRDPERCEVVVVDKAHGALRWRHEFSSRVSAVTMWGQRVFAMTDENLGGASGPDGPLRFSRVMAFDARSGAALWQRDVAGRPSGSNLYADRDLLVWTGASRDLHVLDPQSGSVRASITLPGMSRRSYPLALSGSVAVVPVVMSSRSQDPGEELRFVVIDLPDGHTRWQTPTLRGRAPLWRAAPPVIDLDAIYTCGPDGVLRAHDLSTGEVRWQWSVGRCDTVAPLEDPRAGALALGLPWGDYGVTVFRRLETEPPPMESAVITGVVNTGRPAADARVLVGGEAVPTDRRGRFRATVQGRGIVRVLALARSTPENSAQYVELMGTLRAYTLRFDELPGD